MKGNAMDRSDHRRILQLLPSITRGDAVSNDAMEIHRTLVKAGFESHIYAEYIGTGLDPQVVSPVNSLPEAGVGDIILFHLSTGSHLQEVLRRCKAQGCKILFRYHNITPPEFYRGYHPFLEKKCRDGRKEAGEMRDIPDAVLSVSDYNRQDLLHMGYTCPMEIVPILIPFADYEKTPDEEVLNRYKTGDTVNVLFTGRVAPNKKLEHVIAAFAAYYYNYNANARLFLVGNDAGTESYRRNLQAYAEHLGLREKVIFTGHTTFPELLAYYRCADIFLCMSEHEGFCIPLVEAMYFDIPVIALNAAAVEETLGGAGVLLPDSRPEEAAGKMAALEEDSSLRESVLAGQRERWKQFGQEKTAGRFLEVLRERIS